MARSSVNDPIEKFRFLVTIIDDTTATALRSSSLGNSPLEGVGIRAGFKEVTTPRATISEISYRDNVSANYPIKIAGLSSFEPITLRRGVTTSKQLYNWYKLINDDAVSINRFTEALAGLGSPPIQDPQYRKEVLLSSLDRSGAFVKHWLLINAWPNGYKGADDFDSASETILIEELSLTYETFLEVSGATIQEALRSAESQAEEATKRQAAAGLLSTILGT